MENGWFLKEVKDAFAVPKCIRPKAPLNFGDELLRRAEKNVEGFSRLELELTELKGHSMEHYYHSLRVGYVFLSMVKAFCPNLVSELSRDTLSVVGFVHDVGKVYVPLDLLESNGEISRQKDRDTMNNHNLFSYIKLKEYESEFPNLALISVQHHAYKGGRELKYKNEIEGRIRGASESIKTAGLLLSACDCFEGVCSARTYRGPMPRDEAMSWVTLSAPSLEIVYHLFDNHILPAES